MLWEIVKVLFGKANNKMKKNICRLCNNSFFDKEMSEEHYPARSVGNNDIIAFDIVEMLDAFIELGDKECITQKDIDYMKDEKFNKCIAKELYPNGRTARTLCKECNHFLGKYDESYLKFFYVNGECSIIKGFNKQTKLNIIKAIYGKFLSIPETVSEKFDFVNFIKDEKCEEYNGKWKLYIIKRNYTTDLMGMPDLGTGKLIFDNGIVYEMSDEKFIFNLLNFKKHDSIEMTDIFDILKKDYFIVEGISENGSYHEQIFLLRMFEQMND